MFNDINIHTCYKWKVSLSLTNPPIPPLSTTITIGRGTFVMGSVKKAKVVINIIKLFWWKVVNTYSIGTQGRKNKVWGGYIVLTGSNKVSPLDKCPVSQHYPPGSSNSNIKSPNISQYVLNVQCPWMKEREDLRFTFCWVKEQFLRRCRLGQL